MLMMLGSNLLLARQHDVYVCTKSALRIFVIKLFQNKRAVCAQAMDPLSVFENTLVKMAENYKNLRKQVNVTW